MSPHNWRKLPREGALDVLDRYKCKQCRIIINCKSGEHADARLRYLSFRVDGLFEDCDLQIAHDVQAS